MTPEQCRAGRALVRASQIDLTAGKKSTCVVARFERGAGEGFVSQAMVGRWRDRLEALGVEFIERGVRLRSAEA